MYITSVHFSDLNFCSKLTLGRVFITTDLFVGEGLGPVAVKQRVYNVDFHNDRKVTSPPFLYVPSDSCMGNPSCTSHICKVLAYCVFEVNNNY